jgi:hypothetical protein
LLTNQEGLNSHHDFVQQLCHNFYRFILIWFSSLFHIVGI